MSEANPRIACYVRFLYGGGAEKAIIHLIKGFVDRGIKVDLILNNIGGAYWEEIPPQVNIINLNTSRLLLGLPKIVNYLKKNQPVALLSVLHYANEIAVIAKQLAKEKTKVIVIEQNTLSVQAKHQKDSEKWSPLVAKLIYPLADGIVTVSRGVAEDLAKITGLSIERIRTIHNPVITPNLLKKAQEPLDHPWFHPSQPPVILGVGRLSKQKDFPTLIRAFALIRQVQLARLMILGNGPERKNLYTLAKELGLQGDLAMPGFVDNPYSYMAKSSVFVLSSAWEGLPTVLIEALAVHTPVVATNCESGSAEILNNGQYGELVPVGDVEAIANAILKVLSGNIKPVEQSWLDQYTLKSSVDHYLNLIGIS